MGTARGKARKKAVWEMKKYSRTCTKRHRIKRSVVKVPNLFSLYHRNFRLYKAVTSIGQSWSPLPVIIVLHLY